MEMVNRGESQGKRPRLEESEPTIQCTLEDFLSVPLPIIFRRIQQQSKPLLTRAEAQTLIQITDLSREFDILLNLISQARERQFSTRRLVSSSSSSSSSTTIAPALRSLVPTLILQGQRIPAEALDKLHSELDRVLMELESCGLQLKQYSEQNWIMSDSLMDAFGTDVPASGHALANEKRTLGDLQEEVATRIEHLSTTGFEGYEEKDLFMAGVCYHHFGIIKPTIIRQRRHEPFDMQYQKQAGSKPDERHERESQDSRNGDSKVNGEKQNKSVGGDSKDGGDPMDEGDATEEEEVMVEDNRSFHKRSAAQALSTLQDDDGASKCSQEEDTAPLPDMANTQTAVTTLAGLFQDR